MRFPDEFVRHKILDAMGDLALAGAPLIARFEGVPLRPRAQQRAAAGAVRRFLELRESDGQVTL